MKYTTYFLHGLDSSGNGTKGRFFADNFPHIIRPDFTGSLVERLDQLAGLCAGQPNLLFVGSSFGGLMATQYAIDHPQATARLILLAPALNYAEYEPPVQPVVVPTLCVIGDQDTVTPAAVVTPLLQATFTQLTIDIVDDDHLLHATFPKLDWYHLLSD